jgi:hypothetical protein
MTKTLPSGPHTAAAFPVLNKPKIELKRGKNIWEVRKNLQKFVGLEIQFEILFIIKTSSRSSWILNYSKDSESKLS